MILEMPYVSGARMDKAVTVAPAGWQAQIPLPRHVLSTHHQRIDANKSLKPSLIVG